MLPILDPIEVRVLGALLEKSISTPEYYPLSLNALINACNQKSNRDPVMQLDEEAVRNAGGSLGVKGMAAFLRDSRATKYEHRLAEVLNLGRRDEAILCELLLRGPQTPGELRSRTERLHPMDDISDVQSTLQRMMEREPALVCVLPRQPGTKEARYAHLLSGEPDLSQLEALTGRGKTNDNTNDNTNDKASDPDTRTRIATLEQQVTTLQQQVDRLTSRLDDLLAQLA